MEMLIQLPNKADIQILLPLFERLGVSVLAPPQWPPLHDLPIVHSDEFWAMWMALGLGEPFNKQIASKEVTPQLSSKKIHTKNKPVIHSLPIHYAKKANFKALAGIWQNKSVDVNELRKTAWGNRL